MDLVRAMRSPNGFYEATMDLSVTLTSIGDWNYKEYKKRKEANNSTGVLVSWKRFQEHIENNCVELATFSDLANEYKHADRDRTSKFIGHVSLLMIENSSLLDGTEWESSILSKRLNSGMAFLSVVELQNCDQLPFKLFAEKAIDWWSKFDPIGILT